MKTKKWLRYLSLAVAVLMTVTCFAGCSDEDEYEEFSTYEVVSGKNGTKKDDKNSSDGIDNSDTDDSGSSSKKTGGSTSSGKKNSGKTSSGNVIKYATWKDPYTDEDGAVIKSFMEKTGKEVKIVTIPQSDYPMRVAAYIAAGDAPDVYFSNDDFPMCLQNLQPLNSLIDFSDSIWDTEFIKQASINGNKYLVNTIGNIWAECDCVFFNKKLLENNGIKTPAEYYKEGNWTWDTLYKLLKEIKALGSKYTPTTIAGLDIATFLGSSGVSIFSYSNGKWSTNIRNSKLTEAYKFLSQLNAEGLSKFGVTRNEFCNGTVGLWITNAYGLKATGYFQNMKASNLGYTYLPVRKKGDKYYNVALFRGWGICKGSANPKGAAEFIRYYLDVNNYDTKAAFKSKDAETFFFKLTATSSADKFYPHATGMTWIADYEPMKMLEPAMRADPAQVNTELSKLYNICDTAVKRGNEAIAKINK